MVQKKNRLQYAVAGASEYEIKTSASVTDVAFLY
jgi:hypothetical protein